jgi:indole-3-glycerol phosphate synthase
VSQSVKLGGRIPSSKVKISESGISDMATILHLKKYGFKGFLIGENFMKAEDPALAFARFVNELNAVKQ